MQSTQQTKLARVVAALEAADIDALVLGPGADSFYLTGFEHGHAAERLLAFVVRRDTLPECLEITAETAEGDIMGVRHKELDIQGVQFHRESVLTEGGKELLRNFVKPERQI